MSFTKQIFVYGKHPSKFAHIYSPKVPNKLTKILIVLYHGGFFKSQYTLDLMEPIARQLVAEGYTVANVEYPRVGEGLSCEHMLRSVLFSFSSICKHVAGIEKRVVMGHSAGGYYAMMIGAQANLPIGLRTVNLVIPDLVIAQAPVTDLWRGHKDRLSDKGDAIANFVGESNLTREGCSQLSPIRYPMPKTVRLLIAHGLDDKTVPLTYSEDYELLYNNCSLYSGEFGHMDVVSPEHSSWYVQKTFIFTEVFGENV